MLKSLKDHVVKLFWGGHDNDRRDESSAQDAARMLEMDEPMAGAGAQLSGMHKSSETEDALKRASKNDAE